MNLPKNWQQYAHSVTSYLQNSLSSTEFLGKYSLYQLGFITEEGSAEDTPKTGKLLRPTLLLLTMDVVTSGNWHAGIPAAAAIEIFHNGTLLVDDWQDGDRKRRGRQALWTLPQVGPRQAMNVGLFLFTLSSKVMTLLDSSAFSPESRTKAQLLFEDAKMDVIRGQQLDIAYEKEEVVSLPDYFIMIELKTQRLIQTSLLVGALLGGAPEKVYKNLSLFGKELGLLFQLQDDYLGIYGNEAAMGKPADDLIHKKKSLPVVLAMEQAMGNEKKLLLDMYNQTELLNEEEVKRVKQILEKLSIQEKTRNMIEETYKKALSALDAIPDGFSKIDDLRSLAHLFAHREK